MSEEIKYTIEFAARSEFGLVRKNNEDNLYCNGVCMTVSTRERPFFLSGFSEIPGIFAVCDGMGGEADGELASLTAVETLFEHSKAIIAAASFHHSDINNSVQNFVTQANEKLISIMKKNPSRLGTTLALVVISKNFVHAYNIGDSRIYAFQNDSLSQITEDHTLAVQKVKMGMLTKEQAERDRSRNVLTRCLGVFDDEMTLVPDIIEPIKISKGLRILLCSDGLSGMISNFDIENALKNFKDPKSAVNSMIEGALKNGGKDNVTCIVIKLGGVYS